MTIDILPREISWTVPVWRKHQEVCCRQRVYEPLWWRLHHAAEVGCSRLCPTACTRGTAQEEWGRWKTARGIFILPSLDSHVSIADVYTIWQPRFWGTAFYISIIISPSSLYRNSVTFCSNLVSLLFWYLFSWSAERWFHSAPQVNGRWGSGCEAAHVRMVKPGALSIYSLAWTFIHPVAILVQQTFHLLGKVR